MSKDKKIINNVLDSWIYNERLEEGTLSNSKKAHFASFSNKDAETLCNKTYKLYFKKYLEDELKKYLKDNKMSKDYEPGILMYFGCYSVDLLKNILKVICDNDDKDENFNVDYKFSVKLAFDKELNLVPDKCFFTEAGYIIENNKFSDDLKKFEKDSVAELDKKFKDNFDETFDEVLKSHYNSEYAKSIYSNFRFMYVDLNSKSADDLHSFFIDDLETAKKLKECKLLDNYIMGSPESNRVNLITRPTDDNFNIDILNEILMPNNCPLGRFPSNPKFAQSLMQQVSINIATSYDEYLRSVNGPPGTGKTTLLKDIFASHIVDQAKAIIDLDKKSLEKTVNYFSKAYYAKLPEAIYDKNIVVASSNNGAVQNVVTEMPLNKEVYKDFIDELLEVDYFTEEANSKLKRDENNEVLEEDKAKLKWGLFSAEGGAKDKVENIIELLDKISIKYKDKVLSADDLKAYDDFKKLYHELKRDRNLRDHKAKAYLKSLKEKKEYLNSLAELEKEKEETLENIREIEKVIDDLSIKRDDFLATYDFDKSELNRELSDLESEKDLVLECIEKGNSISFGIIKRILKKAQYDAHKLKQIEYKEVLKNVEDQIAKIKEKLDELEVNLECVTDEISEQEEVCMEYKDFLSFTYEANKKNLNNKIERINNLVSNLTPLDETLSYDEFQISNPWFDEEYRIKSSRLFILALKVRKNFIIENIKNVIAAKNIWRNLGDYTVDEEHISMINDTWQWINFVVPVIGTTFASLRRMFMHIDVNKGRIANLFVDEAGQAVPQAVVGGLIRAKRVMVVGDPSQIKPVRTLDKVIQNIICKKYNVNDIYSSDSVSVQSLVDRASKYGFMTVDENTLDNWIGIPLWVHRRCMSPMFDISNTISYNGNMVQGKGNGYNGKAWWYDVKGIAYDKFVKEQCVKLIELIKENFKNEKITAEDIYVITPFTNVEKELKKAFKDIKFTEKIKGKDISIGTVHKFQGKETKIVYLVLGADDKEYSAAASWAVSEPNLVNVAATRAREEFYVIGDKTLYLNTNKKASTEMIRLIDEFNNKEKEIEKDEM